MIINDGHESICAAPAYCVCTELPRERGGAALEGRSSGPSHLLYPSLHPPNSPPCLPPPLCSPSGGSKDTAEAEVRRITYAASATFPWKETRRPSGLPMPSAATEEQASISGEQSGGSGSGASASPAMDTAAPQRVSKRFDPWQAPAWMGPARKPLPGLFRDQNRAKEQN